MSWKSKEDLTKRQREFVETFRLNNPKPVKVKRQYSEHQYYNPNDYIQLSPKELEEQGKRVLEEMKKNADPWHSQNELANRQH